MIPIYKKGDPTDPSNYRPISLTSVLRKLFERCLLQYLIDNSPPLDLAQGGFRHARGSLDQALCLVEICNILRRYHHFTPVLAFLDIKSAYDTVDRHYIWITLETTAPKALICLLQNLFDEVHIEVLLHNANSFRFTPTTGVLQGSILSPFLYSTYINELPKLLRPQQLPHDTSPIQLAPFINCLLYADDVVLITDKDRMRNLLHICEDHSYKLGYRWNPSKCVVLDPSNQSPTYYLYGDPLPVRSSFPYLGVPIRPGGYLHTFELLTNNINKSLATMNQLTMIGLNPNGFGQLIATRFYKQIVRAQLEYGLAISKVTSLLSDKLEDAQNICLRSIFGGSSRSSIKVMLHLAKLPTMTERIHILQAQFLLRSLSLPDDTLLANLLPHIRLPKSHSQWYAISKTPLWKRCTQHIDSLDKRLLKKLRLQYLQDNWEQRRAARNSGLLALCRPKISLDPILWLPMSRIDRNRCVRWRLGWLPGYKTVYCARHPTQLFTKQHAVHCSIYIADYRYRRLPLILCLSFLISCPTPNRGPVRQDYFGRPDGLSSALFYKRWTTFTT